MIQPTLMSYTFNTPPMPILLDSVSIKHHMLQLRLTEELCQWQSWCLVPSWSLQPLQQGSHGLIQLVTHYQHSSGQQWLSLATMPSRFSPCRSFFWPRSYSSPDVLYCSLQSIDRWLAWCIVTVRSHANSTLPKVCRKKDPTSFRLTNNFSIYSSVFLCSISLKSVLAGI